MATYNPSLATISTPPLKRQRGGDLDHAEMAPKITPMLRRVRTLAATELPSGMDHHPTRRQQPKLMALNENASSPEFAKTLRALIDSCLCHFHTYNEDVNDKIRRLKAMCMACFSIDLPILEHTLGKDVYDNVALCSATYIVLRSVSRGTQRIGCLVGACNDKNEFVAKCAFVVYVTESDKVIIDAWKVSNIIARPAGGRDEHILRELKRSVPCAKLTRVACASMGKALKDAIHVGILEVQDMIAEFFAIRLTENECATPPTPKIRKLNFDLFSDCVRKML